MNQGSIYLVSEEEVHQAVCNKRRKLFLKKASALARIFNTTPEAVVQLFANSYFKLISDCQNQSVLFDPSIIDNNPGFTFSIWDLVRKTLCAELAWTEAHTDKLTKINNRRAFDLEIEKKAKTERRTTSKGCNAIFSLIMFDIDDFKGVNDAFGHTVGDFVLQLVAQTANENLKRPQDFLARWGGEEFIIIVDEDIESASKLAEKIRIAIASINFLDLGIDRTITASFGVSSYKVCDNDLKKSLSLLNDKTDEALAIAKKSGKNCTVIKN